MWEFIGERLKAQNLDFAADPLRQALEDGKALVLFDGLDEIAGRAPARAVRDAVAAFAGRYDRSRYLVTCRTLSYQGSRLAVARLSGPRVGAFQRRRRSAASWPPGTPNWPSRVLSAGRTWRR